MKQYSESIYWNWNGTHADARSRFKDGGTLITSDVIGS